MIKIMNNEFKNQYFDIKFLKKKIIKKKKKK